jgi:hypothetical protein
MRSAAGSNRQFQTEKRPKNYHGGRFSSTIIAPGSAPATVPRPAAADTSVEALSVLSGRIQIDEIDINGGEQ